MLRAHFLKMLSSEDNCTLKGLKKLKFCNFPCISGNLSFSSSMKTAEEVYCADPCPSTKIVIVR